jgi:hypothetical protein
MLDIARTDRNFKFLMIPSDTLFWYFLQPNTSNDLLQIIQCGGPEKMALSASIK